jgi:general secretion pathway protein C
MTRRRQAILLAYLTLGAFLVAHLVNAFVSQALTGPLENGARSVLTTSVARVPAVSARLAEEILQAELFASVRPPAGTMVMPDGVPNDKPLDAAKKVKLVGTVIGEGVGALAILEDLRSKKQLLYHLYERISDVGQIVEVRRDGIVIQEGRQQEFLELAVTKVDGSSATRPAVPSTPASTVRSGVSGGGRLTLDRRVVSESVADVPKLLSQAQAAPYYNEGKLEGWRIDSIKPDSFYEKIGLQAGDVLQRVNGVEIRDPGMMLTLFQQVRDERLVKLDLLRNNQRTTLTYDIR